MSARDAAIRARLMATFREEAEEHIHLLTANLMDLGRSGIPEDRVRELVEATFRSAHTLKGASRSMGMRDIESVCQALESVLRPMSRGELQLSESLVASLNDGVVIVERLLGGEEIETTEIAARLELLAEEPPPSVAPTAAEQPPEQPMEATHATDPQQATRFETLRVSRSKLDELLLQGEDLLLLKLAAAERVQQAREVANLLIHSQTSHDLSLSRDMARAVEAVERLLGQLDTDERIAARRVDRLHHLTRQMRMAPVSTVFDLIPLMVHELASDQGKEIELMMRGTELELDLQILEGMKDPLIHLIRNAVDHGIESPEAREQAGKPRKGRIELRVGYAENARVEISIEDDGAGVDPQQIRAAAVRGRFLAPEAAAALSDEAAVDMLFHSGFSTSAVVTEISGNGLGLSIVREAVERLGGHIHMQGRRGEGTSIHVVVPATVATFRALLVRAAEDEFLIPLNAVQRSILVHLPDVHLAQNREVIRWEGRIIPIGRLSNLLDLPASTTTNDGFDHAGDTLGPAVVLKSGDQYAAILVDDVVGDREVLIRELRAPLVRVPHIASAGLLGNGGLVLVLRPSDLTASLHDGSVPHVAIEDDTPRTAPMIVTADDSITTRTLIRNVLEAAGYRVRVAVDGLDAWSVLKDESPDLLVSDIDMPGMNGFDLTARVRMDPDLGELPVVLVTSLDSREDKERGIAVGANAYVVKSDMEQSNLLQIIRRFV